MIRRPLRCAVSCALASAVTLVCTLLGLPAQATPHQAIPTTPLLPVATRTADDGAPRVSIESLQPTSLRVGRPIELSGVVRNTTDEDWSAVQVSMTISESPVTSPENLRNARTDRDTLALRQVLAPGDFRNLGDLAPGTESSFTLRNVWDSLPITGASGAYVVGVEVRAFLEDGLRSTVADTTTFIPLVTPESGAEPVDLAMVWPLTVGVPRSDDGYVESTLARQFSDNGRLTELTRLGANAGDFPLTWIIDPAVLDAARDMADGFALRAEPVPADDERAVAAEDWLTSTLSALEGSDVLALPYGDPDVASLAHGGLRRALTPVAAATTTALAGLEIDQTNLLWPAKGWMDHATLRAGTRLAPAFTLLAEDSTVGDDTRTVVPLGAGGGAHPGVTYPRRAVSPRADESTLQWRQQLLAVTAVRALDDPRPLVVVPPRTLTLSPDWESADFFAGLRGSWIRPRPLNALTPNPSGRSLRLHYPEVAERRELPASNIIVARELVQARDTLLGILADPDTSQQRLGEAIGIGTSIHWRDEPQVGEALTTSYVESIRTRLQEIVVEAPSFITLSGDEGPFPITVSNGLDDQAIRVGVDVDASGEELRIQPIDKVTIEPQQRRSIPVQATFDGVGISTVTVRLLDSEGEPFGDPVAVRIRTTQIGEVIWVVMAVGALIIFAAATRSVIRRIRRRDGSSRRSTGAGP